MKTKTILAAALVGVLALITATAAQAADKPNIVFVLMDNLGYGEVGSYGGGILRGVPTPRIDKLATEGTRLLNFNVEATCTPSRSAIMTGRHPIRSGTHSVSMDGKHDGLTLWEVTIAELLSGQGYATALFGKWHLGSDQSRMPTGQGFDEWFGILHSTDESYWPEAVGFKESGVEPGHIMEGRKGEPSRELEIYDVKQRRLIDTEITRRAVDFMKRSVKAGKPFYAYVPFTFAHVPVLPHPDFVGKTGFGNFPDALAEMDFHVGQLLDAVDELGIRDNTIFVFVSDNGPDPDFPHQGTSGPWSGYMGTHMEGSSRTPFIIRWPGQIPAGRVSNEIVHETDTFTTFAKIAGAPVPQDRPIDGVDQTEFLLGKKETSNREGILLFVADRLEAVKWRNWKLHLYDVQRDWHSPSLKLVFPKLFNLILDPKEEYPVFSENTWVLKPMNKMIAEFMGSTQKNPLIAPGTPDPYTPPK